jgi:PKD repeat protein
VKTDYVSVSVPPTAPTADFTADQTDGFVPLSVQFTDASSSGGQPITSWRWTFGDGGTSTSQNPSHTYLVPGTYDVKLRVANSVGPDSTTKSGYVTAQVVPVAPTANFTGTPTSGDAPLSVDFTDVSDPGTSPITIRSWQFGDGGTSSATNPSHTYSTPGTYTVTLTVTTIVGSDDETKTDYVSVSVPPTKPTADFTGTPTSGFAPLQVDFTDQSTDGGATITSWLWRFGDGATSTAQNPSHTYGTPGTYDVTLRVTNSAGPDSTTKNNYVTASVVPVGPSAEFSGTPTSGDAPLSVTFTDLSDPGTSPITAYAWDFGDGGTSTEANPSHEYTTPGTYTVSLQVTTAVNSSTATKDSYVTVNVPPTLGARTR